MLAACATLTLPEVTPSAIALEDTDEPTERATSPHHPEDTLIVCLGLEPESLYPFSTPSQAAHQVWEAIYDGPIDSRSYAFQEVILTKLPSLANGDASIASITVQQGTRIVDADGHLTRLIPGTRVRPAGCSSADCAFRYPGGLLEMDQMVATYQLQPGLTWSDGAPLTAADSVFAFQIYTNSNTPGNKLDIERTAVYKALDRRTVIWRGLPGDRSASYFNQFWTPIPAHVWGELDAGSMQTDQISTRKPLGWGPYVIESWTENEEIILRKNLNYFRVDEGLPRFNTLIYKISGTDPEKNINALLHGECDVLDQTALLEADTGRLIQLDRTGELQAVFAPSEQWEHLDFGIDTRADRADFFGDVRVRQAFALCIDRHAIIEKLLYGIGGVPQSYLPVLHPYYNRSLETSPFDPRAGASLLEEVGWVLSTNNLRQAQGVDGVPNGTRFTVNYVTTPATLRQQVAQMIALDLESCGIQVNLEFINPGLLFENGPEGPLYGRNFDLAQFAWQTTVSPQCELYTGGHIPGSPDEGFTNWRAANISGFNANSFDAACLSAQNSLPWDESFAANHNYAQLIFSRQLPAIPLFSYFKQAATRPDFCGFRLDPSQPSDLWNIENFGYGEMCAP